MQTHHDFYYEHLKFCVPPELFFWLRACVVVVEEVMMYWNRAHLGNERYNVTTQMLFLLSLTFFFRTMSGRFRCWFMCYLIYDSHNTQVFVQRRWARWLGMCRWMSARVKTVHSQIHFNFLPQKTNFSCTTLWFLAV